MYQIINDTCIRRLSDGACIPSDPLNVDYAAYLVWVAEGNTPLPAPVVDPKPALIAAAWSAADAHARQGLDENARASLLWYAMDPACPEWRKARIAAVQAWWAAVWVEYAAVRARIDTGESAIYDPATAGPCPFSIWQLASEI